MNDQDLTGMVLLTKNERIRKKPVLQINSNKPRSSIKELFAAHLTFFEKVVNNS
jgi:hypothetical protein